MNDEDLFFKIFSTWFLCYLAILFKEDEQTKKIACNIYNYVSY